jgi:hypothetical protein
VSVCVGSASAADQSASTDSTSESIPFLMQYVIHR